METITSTTGIGHGWGSDPYKWVSKLTKTERGHVRAGTARILITGCPSSGGGNGTGTTQRVVVIDNRGGYTHRMP